MWFQHTIAVGPFPQGLHLVTDQVCRAMPELNRCRAGLLHVFIQHTSASLMINENADPVVPQDLETALKGLAPEDYPYRHTCEGPDDMPAHIKSILTSTSVSIPILQGRLALGTWQGIYLWEHRHYLGRRQIVVHLTE